MKAIILARVSDKKQDSNEAQIVRVSDYVKRTGLIVWKTYEIEESSTSGDRRKYHEVIVDVEKAKETIAIVVDTVDRLQRSFKESVQLDELRKAGKLEIHFYREGLILRKDSNSSELMRWDMAVMFARGYVLQLSDNVKRKQDQMLRDGQWPGRPPIGYESVYDSDGKRTNVIPDPLRAHLVRKMFELYASGNHSILTIRNLITKEGLVSSAGKPLALSMVDSILNNTFYHGLMFAKGKSFPHKYCPLITKELFDKCRNVREGWKKKPFKYASKPFMLRGLVRCGKCGCSMSPEIKKGKFVYYSCTNAKKDVCSKRIYVPEKDLMEPVYGILESFKSIPQKRIDRLVEGLQKSTDAKNKYHKQAIASLQTEYSALQNKIDRMVDLLIEGSITSADYDKKLKEFKDKQYDISLQLEAHIKADESYYLVATTVFNLAKGALDLFESSEVSEKRAILNYMLQNYTVNEKTPCITMRSPFNELLVLHKQSAGLHRQDSNL